MYHEVNAAINYALIVIEAIEAALVRAFNLVLIIGFFGDAVAHALGFGKHIAYRPQHHFRR